MLAGGIAHDFNNLLAVILSSVRYARSNDATPEDRADALGDAEEASESAARLVNSWKQPDGRLLRTYTIVTTEPNDVLRPIHNRMPVMLTNDDARRWLAVDQISHALSLLKPYPADAMEGYDVPPLVNDPRNDSPECVGPVEGLNTDDGTIQGLLDFR